MIVTLFGINIGTLRQLGQDIDKEIETRYELPATTVFIHAVLVLAFLLFWGVMVWG
jgi:hypothetical protein